MQATILERLRTNYGGKEKPNDLLQWLVDTAPSGQRNVRSIAERVMSINLAAIYKTTAVSSRATYRWERGAELRSCVDVDGGHRPPRRREREVYAGAAARDPRRLGDRSSHAGDAARSAGAGQLHSGDGTASQHLYELSYLGPPPAHICMFYQVAGN